MALRIGIIVLFAFASCAPTENEFGRSRASVSRFSFDPVNDETVFKIIDTSAVYLLQPSQLIIEGRKNRYVDPDKIEGIKFYSNGKVGYFNTINFSDANTLNSHQAIMGIYKKESEDIVMEFLSRSPQRGAWIWKETIVDVSSDKDTLKSEIKENNDKVIYLKHAIPDNFIINKPDW